MGLRKRGDIWVVRKKIDGRRVEMSTGHTDINLARKRAAQLIGRLIGEDQGIIPKTGVTFAQWWATYDAEYTSQKAVSTQRRDRGIITPWLALWGPRVMASIQQADCLAGLRRRRMARAGTLAEGTIQRERRLLQAVFERAVDNNHIPKNPWKGIKGVKDEVRERLLTAEDEVKLRAAIADPGGNAGSRRQATPDVWLRWLTFMLETGLRLDECLSLDRAKQTHEGYVTVLGKGSKWRDVPLTTKAKEALAGGLWRVTPNRTREVLAAACKRAGIAHISPHDLRHTFGHRYLQRGGRIHNLSKILGHASIVVTETHYATLLKDDIATEMLAVMEPPVVDSGHGHQQPDHSPHSGIEAD
jgi:integrase